MTLSEQDRERLKGLLCDFSDTAESLQRHINSDLFTEEEQQVLATASIILGNANVKLLVDSESVALKNALDDGNYIHEKFTARSLLVQQLTNLPVAEQIALLVRGNPTCGWPSRQFAKVKEVLERGGIHQFDQLMNTALAAWVDHTAKVMAWSAINPEEALIINQLSVNRVIREAINGNRHLDDPAMLNGLVSRVVEIRQALDSPNVVHLNAQNNFAC